MCCESSDVVRSDLGPLLQGQTFYLFGVLRCFQHCTGHITMGSWKRRGNQYIQFVRVLYCKLPTNGKQLPAFPLEVMPGTEPWPQRWEVRVLPLCHHGPLSRSNEYSKLKSAYNSLIFGPRVWDGKPTYRKSWTGNLLVWLDLTFGPSFKVKGG